MTNRNLNYIIQQVIDGKPRGITMQVKAKSLDEAIEKCVESWRQYYWRQGEITGQLFEVAGNPRRVS